MHHLGRGGRDSFYRRHFARSTAAGLARVSSGAWRQKDDQITEVGEELGKGHLADIFDPLATGGCILEHNPNHSTGSKAQWQKTEGTEKVAAIWNMVAQWPQQRLDVIIILLRWDKFRKQNGPALLYLTRCTNEEMLRTVIAKGMGISMCSGVCVRNHA